MLSFTTVEVLGYVASISGLGVVFGSIYVSKYGTPEGKRVKTIIVLLAIQGKNKTIKNAKNKGFIMMSAILQPGVAIITFAGFFYLLLDPVIIGNLSI